jgi:hypothetical protein
MHGFFTRKSHRCGYEPKSLEGLSNEDKIEAYSDIVLGENDNA